MLSRDTSATRRGWLWTLWWSKNGSIALMIAAQLISSTMAAAAKMLQNASDHHDALDTRQVLMIMMVEILGISWLWGHFANVPNAPLGIAALWPLLTMRGVAGALGIGGFYYSLRSLPISEATVINFLAPMVAAMALSFIGRLAPTLLQQIAGAASIAGVVLVAQPWHLMASDHTESSIELTGNSTVGAQRDMEFDDPSYALTSSLDRITAIAAALVGVAGGSTAYVAMSLVGQRAHPSIIVSHFAAWTVFLTLVSFVVTGFDMLRAPTLSESGLLVYMGTCGSLLHMLIAASLQGEGRNQALNMVYLQIVFALVLDKMVWDISPSWASLGGGMLIIGSVAIVAIAKDQRDHVADASKLGLMTEVASGEELQMMIVEEGRDSLDGQGEPFIQTAVEW